MATRYIPTTRLGGPAFEAVAYLGKLKGNRPFLESLPDDFYSVRDTPERRALFDKLNMMLFRLEDKGYTFIRNFDQKRGPAWFGDNTPRGLRKEYRLSGFYLDKDSMKKGVTTHEMLGYYVKIHPYDVWGKGIVGYELYVKPRTNLKKQLNELRISKVKRIIEQD